MYIHINNHSGASNQTLREIPAVLRNTRGMRGEHTRWLFFSVPNSVKAKTKNSRYFETTTVCTRETQVGETYLRCSPLPLRRRVLDKLSPSSVRINDRAISPLMGGGGNIYWCQMFNARSSFMCSRKTSFAGQLSKHVMT